MTRKVRVAGPDDIPRGEGRSAVVEGRRVAIFHLESGFRAIDARCPHRAGPLADGMVTGACVTCPLHGWKVCLDDGHVFPPNAGRVRVYQVERTAEGVYLFVRDGKPCEVEGSPPVACGEGVEPDGERAA